MRPDNMPRPHGPEHSEPDIVERLRGVHAGTPLEVACKLTDLGDEAAAEITALRDQARRDSAEIKMMTAMVKHAHAALDEARAEVERLRDDLRQAHKDFGHELRDPNGTIWQHATALQARAETAERERDELRGRIAAAVLADAAATFRGLGLPVGSYWEGKRVRLVVVE